jgi:hypothetical protein
LLALIGDVNVAIGLDGERGELFDRIDKVEDLLIPRGAIPEMPMGIKGARGLIGEVKLLAAFFFGEPAIEDEVVADARLARVGKKAIRPSAELEAHRVGAIVKIKLGQCPLGRALCWGAITAAGREKEQGKRKNEITALHFLFS